MAKKGLFTPEDRREVLLRGLGMLETLEYCRRVTGVSDLLAEHERLLVNRMLDDLKIVTILDEVDEELSK